MSSPELLPLEFVKESYGEVRPLPDVLRGTLGWPIQIINDFRQHLLLPGCRTLDIYRILLQEMVASLPQEDRLELRLPSLDELREHVATRFPTVVLSEGGLEETAEHTQIVLWKRLFDPLTPPSEFELAHLRFTGYMDRDQAIHLILSVLIQKFFRHLVRTFSSDIILERCTHGDVNLGLLAEWRILGGSMLVECPDGEELWIFLSKSLVFQLPNDGESFDITASLQETSKAVVMSLKAPRLHQIDPASLKLPVKGAIAGHIRMKTAKLGNGGNKFSRNPGSSPGTFRVRVPCDPEVQLDFDPKKIRF